MSKCNIEDFNLIFKLLEKNYDTHLNIIWSATSLLLIAIGWILTSKEAREYISQDVIAKITAIFSIVITAISHYILLFLTKFTSDALIKKLKLLPADDVPEKLIFDGNHIFIYEITYPDLIVRCLVTLSLFLVLMTLVYRCNSRQISERT